MMKLGVYTLCHLLIFQSQIHLDIVNLHLRRIFGFLVRISAVAVSYAWLLIVFRRNRTKGCSWYPVRCSSTG